MLINQARNHLLAQGRALHQQGDLAGAELCYVQVTAQDPGHHDAMHLLGVLKGQQGDYANGARLINRAITLAPRVSAYHNNLGNLLVKAGDLTAAEKSYRHALRLDVKNGDAHLNLGKLQFTTGDREARRSLKAAQRLSPRSVEVHMSNGRLEERDGNAQMALECYRKAARLAPSYMSAHIAIGNLQFALGNLPEAEDSYRTAIRIDYSNSDAHFNLANLLRASGRLSEAIECYQTALQSSPQDTQDIENNLCLALSELQRPSSTQPEFITSSDTNPSRHDGHSPRAESAEVQGVIRSSQNNSPQASVPSPDCVHYLELGNLLRTEGRLQDAIDAYRTSTQLSPSDPSGWNNLGATLSELGLCDQAEAALRKAIALSPLYAEAYFNLGRHLSLYGDEDSALSMLHRALANNPAHAATYTQLGFIAQNRGRLNEAADFYQQALNLSAESQIARNNLGLVLASAGLPEGLVLLEAAVRDQPDAAERHWHLGEKLLLHGRFDQGWTEYEWRMQVQQFTSQHRSFSQPRWNGTPLKGMPILLYAEQGQGDTLQFVRYAELVARQGGRVILQVQRSLQRLLQPLPWIDVCIAQEDTPPEFSTYAPLMSLPLIFKTSPTTIPAPPSHFLSKLYPAPAQSASSLRVGIVWAGNTHDKRDRLRSTSLSQWAQLARIKGVDFISLQTGEPAEQIDDDLSPFHFVQDCSQVKDFADTAAIIATLDLVITVDTAVAHLAGSMGKPVWILLYNPVDWRWGLEGDQSVWYPTAKLFRQSDQNGWAPVFERVYSDLRDLVDRDRSAMQAHQGLSIAEQIT